MIIVDPGSVCREFLLWLLCTAGLNYSGADTGTYMAKRWPASLPLVSATSAAHSCPQPMSLRPLVAICGTTGVGKSKLAIELALALSQHDQHHRYGGYRGARIINADAMQVYAGIDVLTNKVPVEEQCGVEHLLMGFKCPGEQYVVGQWVKDAMQLVRGSVRDV